MRSRRVTSVSPRKIGSLQTKKTARDDLVAVHYYQPVNRPDKAEFVMGPAHRFGNRKLFQRLLQDGVNQGRKRLSGVVYPGEEPLSLVSFQSFQFGNVFADGTGESKRGAGGLALAIKGGPDGGAAAFLILIGLFALLLYRIV